MRTCLFKFHFQQTVYQQSSITGDEMTDDMIALTDVCRAGTEISFQDTETIFNLISIRTDFKDFDCIFMFHTFKVCCNVIITVILFFIFNNRSINYIIVSCLFSIFSGGNTLNKASYIMGAFLYRFWISKSILNCTSTRPSLYSLL